MFRLKKNGGGEWRNGKETSAEVQPSGETQGRANLAPELSSCEPLGMFRGQAEPQFPYLQNGAKYGPCSWWWGGGHQEHVMHVMHLSC